MSTGPAERVNLWIWTASAVALAASAGSVYLSVGMNLKACPLCFYQRTFAFAVLGVLAVGLLTTGVRGGLLAVLALPAAVGGLTVAGFHVHLELNGTLECPAGLAELGSVPQQSLAAFVVLTLLLGLGVLAGRGEGGFAPVAPLGALVLGVLFGVASILSAPPLPSRTTPYGPNEPLDGCRPAYRSQG